MRSTSVDSSEEVTERVSFAEQYTGSTERRERTTDPAQAFKNFSAFMADSSNDDATTVDPDATASSTLSPPQAAMPATQLGHDGTQQDGEVRLLVRDATSTSGTPFQREGDSVDDYIFS